MAISSRGGGYNEAFAAWASGDAERALALCARLPHGVATSSRVTLLRARALLRLRRPRETAALLEAAADPDVPPCDQAVRAMLLGIAYARAGDVDAGLRILAGAEAMQPEDAAVRSEIALAIALAHYQRRDFTAAGRALERVDPASGTVHARALECRGWIAKCENDFAASYEAFEASLHELERRRPLDGLVEANLVATMSYIAIELLDLDRWHALERRAQDVRWETSGLEYFAFWFDLNRSMAYELEGRPREALQAARNAGARAPSTAFRIFAECRRAAVLFAYGELLGYEDLAASIRRELDAIDFRLLHEFEEINVPVVVAETLALIGDGAGAAQTLQRLDTMSPTQLALLHDEPMKRGYITFVDGLVADANGDAFRAQHRYRDALAAFDAIGMTRRSLFAALRCAQLTRDDALIHRVDRMTRTLPPGSWMRRETARLAAWRADPVLASLTRAEREVLELLAGGMSTGQIASERGRSMQTIRNTVSKMLRTFGVDNRQALINECAARGAFSRPTTTAGSDSPSESPSGSA